MGKISSGKDRWEDMLVRFDNMEKKIAGLTQECAELKSEVRTLKEQVNESQNERGAFEQACLTYLDSTQSLIKNLSKKRRVN